MVCACGEEEAFGTFDVDDVASDLLTGVDLIQCSPSFPVISRWLVWEVGCTNQEKVDIVEYVYHILIFDILSLQVTWNHQAPGYNVDKKNNDLMLVSESGMTSVNISFRISVHCDIL